MDKFEINQFSEIRNVVADLQLCFVDGDSYSRTPTLHEWRQATRLAHRLTLLCSELYGYASACRQYNFATAREKFRVITSQGGEFKLEEKENPDVGTSGENVENVEFTEKEIQQMPKQFKTKYQINKKIVRCRHHKCGANCWTYELRYRADGYNITACGQTVEKAKARFLEKLKSAQRENPSMEDTPTTFSAFALFYFETFRKKKVTAQTYKCDLSRLKLHVLPYFMETPIKKIRPAQCQALIEKLAGEGKTKTADEIYGLLMLIFKAAIAHFIIDRSPMTLVLNVQHESEHGEALTKDDEEKLLARLDGTPYQAAFALALFTGLRPNEYKTARIEGAFVVAVNSKRKTKKIEYKRIPICKRLAAFLEKQPLHFPCLRYMRDTVRETLPGHKLYDLRTTFYSRCKEFEVSENALKEFAGHSLGALGNAYTDLSDEYLLLEGKKLDRW